jgi:hypothetical protein
MWSTMGCDLIKDNAPSGCKEMLKFEIVFKSCSPNNFGQLFLDL